MIPRVIRWKRATPAQARADCASWLHGRGYAVSTIFGDIWLIGRGWG